MKHRRIIPLLAASLLASQAVEAASATLRHGFKSGATYTVNQVYHNVGSSVTEMNMMGQKQVMESPLDHLSQGSWSAKATGKAGKVVLELDYGTQQGGERWGDPMSRQSEQMFGNSHASVTIDPLKGMVAIQPTPADDPIVDTIYRSRLGWLPSFPKKALKAGEGFLHEYTMQSGVITMKSEDDYTLDEVKDGLAYFTVETKSVAVYDYSKMYQQQNMPQGMGGPMGNMTLLYKGEGSAIFDLKQGIFIEREMKTAYSTQKPTGGMISMSMRGSVHERWEMEKR